MPLSGALSVPTVTSARLSGGVSSGFGGLTSLAPMVEGSRLGNPANVPFVFDFKRRALAEARSGASVPQRDVRNRRPQIQRGEPLLFCCVVPRYVPGLVRDRIEPVTDVATGRSSRQQSGAAPLCGGGDGRIVGRRILIKLNPGAKADRRDGRVGTIGCHCHAGEESDGGV